MTRIKAHSGRPQQRRRCFLVPSLPPMLDMREWPRAPWSPTAGQELGRNHDALLCRFPLGVCTGGGKAASMSERPEWCRSSASCRLDDGHFT